MGHLRLISSDLPIPYRYFLVLFKNFQEFSLKYESGTWKQAAIILQQNISSILQIECHKTDSETSH